MKTLTNLSAEVVENPAPSVAFHHTVSEEDLVTQKDGQQRLKLRMVRVSHQHLVLASGQAELCLPLSELWRLAESIDPAFKKG